MATGRDLVGAIRAAIDSSASESDGQVLRRWVKEDNEKVNKGLDEFDQGYGGTWKGVLHSTSATASALSIMLACESQNNFLAELHHEIFPERRERRHHHV